MDSERKAFAWFGNFRHQFTTLCSEADEIIPQEPIKYVRNQLLTVGESFKQFCTDLIEDVIPTFVMGPVEEDDPIYPNSRENATLLSRKMSNVIIDDDQEKTSDAVSSLSFKLVEGKCVDYSSKDSVLAPPELDEAGNNLIGTKLEKNESKSRDNSTSVESSENTEGTINSADEVSSSASAWSTEAIISNDSMESGSEAAVEIIEQESVETVLNSDLPHIVGEETTTPQSSGDQKLDETLIVVDDDEFYSNAEVEADYISDQEINPSDKKKKKKFAGKESCETLSKGVMNEETDEDTECCELQEDEELEKILDEDDWEIV